VYVEDLKGGTNKEIGPKDLFKKGSKTGQGASNAIYHRLRIEGKSLCP
jgi:hypothetical protein